MSRYTKNVLMIADGTVKTCTMAWGFDVALGGAWIDLTINNDDEEVVFDICGKFTSKPHPQIEPENGSRYTRGDIGKIFEHHSDVIPANHAQAVYLDLPF